MTCYAVFAPFPTLMGWVLVHPVTLSPLHHGFAHAVKTDTLQIRAPRAGGQGWPTIGHI